MTSLSSWLSQMRLMCEQVARNAFKSLQGMKYSKRARMRGFRTDHTALRCMCCHARAFIRGGADLGGGFVRGGAQGTAALGGNLCLSWRMNISFGRASLGRGGSGRSTRSAHGSAGAARSKGSGSELMDEASECVRDGVLSGQESIGRRVCIAWGGGNQVNI